MTAADAQGPCDHKGCDRRGSWVTGAGQFCDEHKDLVFKRARARELHNHAFAIYVAAVAGQLASRTFVEFAAVGAGSLERIADKSFEAAEAFERELEKRTEGE